VTSGSVRLAESSIHKAGLPEPPILITAMTSRQGSLIQDPSFVPWEYSTSHSDECIVIEDSPHGIASASRRGYACSPRDNVPTATYSTEQAGLVPNLEKIESQSIRTTSPELANLANWRSDASPRRQA